MQAHSCIILLSIYIYRYRYSYTYLNQHLLIYILFGNYCQATEIVQCHINTQRTAQIVMESC